MIVKNVSGVSRTLVFDRKTVRQLANNASAIIPDTVENMGAALAYQEDGTVSITESFSGSEVIQLQDSPQHALIKIGDMVLGTAASTTLTSNNTNVADGATVTIGNKTYTFKTTLTPTEGQVLIGADADGSLLNLIRAINHTGTPDTDYSCAAAHTQVSAASSVTAHAFVITALSVGAAGNALESTDTSATLSFTGLTFAGGVDDNGDAKYLTIDSEVFEFDSDDTYTDGRTPVTIHATDQLNTGNSLKAAINANAVLAAAGIEATDVLKVSTTEVYVVVLVPDTLVIADVTMTVSAVPLVLTKVSKVVNNAQRVFRRELTAAATSIPVVTGLTVIRAYHVQVRAATGVIKAYDGIIIVSGGTIRLTAGSATVNLASTDLVTVTAVGE